jgi:Cu/Ag efflux protein CusF
MRVKGNVNRSINRIAMAVLAMQMLIGLEAVPALAAGKSQTLTGEVSDAMCGAKHEMKGKAAECTRACMKHGSQYALVVGDKVYTLETSDKAALDKLNDLAGAKAKVTGEVDGTTIAVKSVAAGL